MNTTTPKKENINPTWYLIDADGQILGTVASEIAKILIGKRNPMFATHMNMGGKVVVINAKNVKVTGNKEVKKVYYRHTGFPGGIKEETLGHLMERRPTEALRRAVNGMLPKNKLQNERMKNLFIYEGSQHPHAGQIK